eukprot:2675370-Alexandrium_andersonii.AAC.1
MTSGACASIAGGRSARATSTTTYARAAAATVQQRPAAAKDQRCARPSTQLRAVGRGLTVSPTNAPAERSE